MLSFPAPPVQIDLPHLASLYSLGTRKLRVSVTYFFISIYAIGYSFICVSLASSDSLTGCSKCLWLFFYILHADTHTHSAHHIWGISSVCLLALSPHCNQRLFFLFFNLENLSWPQVGNQIQPEYTIQKYPSP